jgi:hypothetical protein
MSVSEIKSAVVSLPAHDQAELASWLLDILPAPASDDADDDGCQEAERRRAQLDSGQVSPVTAGQFWSGVDRARAQW